VLPESNRIVKALCAFIYLLQNVRGRTISLLNPRSPDDAQAKAEQLGDIDNRNLIIPAGLLVDVLLPQIEIHLAHRATDGDAIRARCCGHFENPAGQLDHHVRPRQRQTAAAAFDLAGPVEAIAAHRGHQLVQRLWIFRVVELKIPGGRTSRQP